MTQEEYDAAQQMLANAETEKSAIEQQRRDCIDKAREWNSQTKACTSRITDIDNATKTLRLQVLAFVQEQRQKATAAAQAAAEAKAKEPQPPNALEALAAEVKQLREQLAAAKG